ncbi:hypothetical protein [Lewinella sp. W8]|uniref:hypothetical protein n=1 Tax=Lewinella sp. W8 TaxID=2528208 RepID=UPI001068BF39|nr:hypothetical protein [Lewinella sp. W8]MTB53012.1 hypothetical protein [Lewinella sp. W8]
MTTFEDTYQFFVVVGNNERRVNPLAADIVFDDVPDGKVDYRRELNTNLTFVEEDFQFFWAAYQSVGICSRHELRIYHESVLRFECILAASSANWTSRDGAVTFTPINVEDNDCLEENLRTEKNIFNFPALGPLRVLIGEPSQVVTCTRTTSGNFPESLIHLASDPPTGCLPDNIGWTVTRRTLDKTVETDIFGQTTVTVVDTAEFQREEFTSNLQPPGEGWVQLGGGLWARQLFTGAVQDSRVDISVGNPYTYQEQRVFSIFGQDEANLPDNGVLLVDILEGLVADCGLDIVSNFLGINPAPPYVNNTAYRAAKNYKEVVIFQKTDILLADAAENATKGEISLEDFFEFLEGLQIYRRVRGNTLRLEHISWFEVNGLDVSAHPDIEDCTDFTNNPEDFPRREEFEWMDQQRDLDFDGVPIVYDRYCATGDPRPIKVSKVSTNIADMQANPDRYANQGFAAVATTIYQGERYILQGPPINGPTALLNAPFAWSVIQRDLYQNNRPLPEGTMNNQFTEFETVEPYKEQEPLVLSMTIPEYFAFDPSRRVNSQLGWGKVSKCSFSSFAARLSLNLKHDE